MLMYAKWSDKLLAKHLKFSIIMCLYVGYVKICTVSYAGMKVEIVIIAIATYHYCYELAIAS